MASPPWKGEVDSVVIVNYEGRYCSRIATRQAGRGSAESRYQDGGSLGFSPAKMRSKLFCGRRRRASVIHLNRRRRDLRSSFDQGGVFPRTMAGPGPRSSLQSVRRPSTAALSAGWIVRAGTPLGPPAARSLCRWPYSSLCTEDALHSLVGFRVGSLGVPPGR